MQIAYSTIIQTLPVDSYGIRDLTAIVFIHSMILTHKLPYAHTCCLFLDVVIRSCWTGGMYTLPLCECSCKSLGLDWANSEKGSSRFVLGMHRRNSKPPALAKGGKFSTIIFLRRVLVRSFKSGNVIFFTPRPAWYNSSSSSSERGTWDWLQYATQTNCFVQGTGRCFFPLLDRTLFPRWPKSSFYSLAIGASWNRDLVISPVAKYPTQIQVLVQNDVFFLLLQSIPYLHCIS